MALSVPFASNVPKRCIPSGTLWSSISGTNGTRNNQHEPEEQTLSVPGRNPLFAARSIVVLVVGDERISVQGLIIFVFIPGRPQQPLPQRQPAGVIRCRSQRYWSLGIVWLDTHGRIIKIVTSYLNVFSHLSLSN